MKYSTQDDINNGKIQIEMLEEQKQLLDYLQVNQQHLLQQM